MMPENEVPDNVQRSADFSESVTPSVTIMTESAGTRRCRKDEENDTSCKVSPDTYFFPKSLVVGRCVHPQPKEKKKQTWNSASLTEDNGGEVSKEDGPTSSAEGDCSRSAPSSADLTSSSPKTLTTSSETIDAALQTLKAELTAMREQDLHLLKQLIHINDNIRRLKRARWLQKGGRTVSCGTLGARSPAPQPPGATTLGVPGSGDRASVLLRQRSEPGLLGLPRRKVSTQTSTSSFETIEDEEEVDSLYGSSTDLASDSSPAPSPFSSSSSKPSTPSTPLPRSSPAYPSLTFTQEELWRGESSYGEILKRNIRLWKWSVAREKESGVVDGHPCVL